MLRLVALPLLPFLSLFFSTLSVLLPPLRLASPDLPGGLYVINFYPRRTRFHILARGQRPRQLAGERRHSNLGASVCTLRNAVRMGLVLHFLYRAFRNLCLALESASKRASRYERQIKDLEVSHLFWVLRSLSFRQSAPRPQGGLYPASSRHLPTSLWRLTPALYPPQSHARFPPRPWSRGLRSYPIKTCSMPHALRTKLWIKLPGIFLTRSRTMTDFI